LTDFAPPAAPVGVSQTVEATQYVIIQVPNDWDGGMHPTPKRQLLIILTGAVEMIASDGVSRSFGPGMTLLMEDTSGKGHITKCSDDTTVIMVQLT
jgi:hypothetical protein